MTYEYVCEACGHQWEAEQSIKDSPLKKCVSCGAEKAKRLVSGGTGFLLKGGGWYADLYGSPGASKAASSEDKSSKAGAPGAKAETAAPSADKAASTSESKPSTTAAPSTSTPGSGSTPAASNAKAS
jgi:putative FmdB family regulatory protein